MSRWIVNGMMAVAVGATAFLMTSGMAPVASADPAETPTPGSGTMRPSATTAVYNENGYAKLDPARYGAARLNDERVLIAILEPLTTLSPETGKVAPGAASSWTQSSDGLEWTFKLRKTAKWDDGSPVTSEDFLRSWKRTLKRATRGAKASPWAGLFNVMQGCRDIIADANRTELFSRLRKELEREGERHKAEGIPGNELNEMLDDLGVRPYLIGVKGGRSLRSITKWKDDRKFQFESVGKVVEAIKKARKEAKKRYSTGMKSFGKSGSGAHAPDAHTIVVRTEGVVPFLPGRARPRHLRADSQELRSVAREALRSRQ